MKDLEGHGRVIIEVLYRHLPAWKKNISQNSSVPAEVQTGYLPREKKLI
jgi:hypothetical protein